jgi:hypothetical protein
MYKKPWILANHIVVYGIDLIEDVRELMVPNEQYFVIS